MSSHLRRGAFVALAGGMLLGGTSAAMAADLADKVANLRLETPQTFNATGFKRTGGVHESLRNATGLQTVSVRLRDDSTVQTTGLRSQNLRALRMDAQDRFIARHAGRAQGMRVIARTQLVLNAVFMEVDASAIKTLAADRAVASVTPVGDYQLDLSDTVPYIGGTAVQNMGFDGSGVSIAILDSGIDYTHEAFGGPGTVAAYEAAHGPNAIDRLSKTRDGLFPTAKVVEGYDFVGEGWPNRALSPDPDPIDYQGHGTNVADITAGALGVAPGADLYAVKVCSAISSSCSGIALIQGMDYAVDPNGDGSTDDHVDIINMSLGSSYGQPFDDDLALAVENASAIGVLTVASAGNGSDKPYITGTPAAAATALSVAQTQVPSAALQLLTVGGEDYTAVFQSWSATLESVIEAPIQYADGAGGNLNGCAAFADGSLAGKTVLVDRGACSFTTKIFNVGNAGGLVGIIGLVAPGAPFSGGFADPGGPITIPGFMISQADADAMRASIDAGDDTSIADPGNVLPLVQSMVSSSSRGPRNFDNQLKPEIGAPGASVSALVGTGDGTRVFGGTSGAAPMVSGAAALAIDAFADRGVDIPVPVLKALLINTAEEDIATDPFVGKAPVSRIGGGEVRVDRAIAADAIAWDADALQGALSFGFVDVADTTTMSKQVNVLSVADEETTWTITPSFRFDDDAATGAITPSVSSSSVTVPAGESVQFELTLTIDGSKLPGNFMNSGSNGANPNVLTINEYDGYLTLDNGEQQIHLPWHVLPRKAAAIRAQPNRLSAEPQQSIALINDGVGTAQIDAYSLIALSRNIPSGDAGTQAPTPDIRAVGVTTVPVPAGACSDNESFIWAFAINTWERQTHLLPVSHQVGLDIDRDGTEDYIVLNRDLSFTSISDGRQGTFVYDTQTEDTTLFFFAEHATNTGNTVLYACAEQLGMSIEDLGTTTVDATVFAQDFYFGGPGDLIEGLAITPGTERYSVTAEDIEGLSSGSIDVTDNGAFSGNSTEHGLLLFTNGDRGSGARGGAIRRSEAIVLRNFAP